MVGHRDDVNVLDIPEKSAFATHELSYVHTESEQDQMLAGGLATTIGTLIVPIAPEIEKHYTDTKAALNRMRRQLSRPDLFA